MRKKRLLILLWAIITVLPATAQWSIGGSLGAIWDRPFLYENKYDFYHYYSSGIVQTRRAPINNNNGININSINYQIDLSVLRQISNRWSIVSGLSFQQKGYGMMTRIRSFIKCNDWYFSLPIMAEFSFVKTSHDEVFIDAGIYTAYWCDSYRKYLVPAIFGEIINGIEEKEFNKDVDNRFEFGLIGGVGYKHHFGTKWTCFAAARYQYALTKQFKEPQTMDFLSHNNAFVFLLGLLYNL